MHPTTSLSSTAYKGVILVSAYGPIAAPSGAPSNTPVAAPSGTPNTVRATITWNGFTGATINTRYALERTRLGDALDMTNEATCQSDTITSCRVCTITLLGAGAKTCTDTNVDVSPAKYSYAVTLISSDNVAEELPVSGDSSYRISVYIPPDNMVLVHRDSVNYEMCINLLGRTMSSTTDPGTGPDPLNHQRCTYTGMGGRPFNSGPDNPDLTNINGSRISPFTSPPSA